MTLAQEAARLGKAPNITPVHLLVGVFREGEGVGYRILANRLDESTCVSLLDTEATRLGATEEYVAQIPFTTPAKKVLENALREALSLGHNYIGTEHILLAIERCRHYLPSDADAALGFGIRDEIMRVLSGSGSRKPPPSPPRPPDPSPTPTSDWVAGVGRLLESVGNLAHAAAGAAKSAAPANQTYSREWVEKVVTDTVNKWHASDPIRARAITADIMERLG